MKEFKLFILFAALPWSVSGQELRSSIIEYQFTSLQLNPAYSSKLDASGFTATYFGNLSAENLVSRAATLNLQGATEQGGIGLTFQFYQVFSLGEINLRPAWSKRFRLPNGADISFGAVLGVNYFDLDDFILSRFQSNFLSLDGGAGVYYHSDYFFAGLSLLSIFESSFGLETINGEPGLERERPFNLHLGGVFPLLESLELKPVTLLRYINTYELPKTALNDEFQSFSLDLQLNVMIDQAYVVGINYGFTNPEQGYSITRAGLSFTYVFRNFRLSYAFQNNSRRDNAVSLPVSHLISAGYDFGELSEEGKIRYF